MFLHILNLLRVKDWLKNLLIFVPLIFSDNLLNSEYYLELFFAFILFSFVCSVIYVLNDIKDIKADKLHPIKKNIKPLANGQLSVFFAQSLIVLLIIIILILLLLDSTILPLIGGYVFLNLSYNYFLKNIPIIDILIISIGYILRIESGSAVIDVTTSLLMIFSIFTLAVFILSIKRKTELENNLLSRSSLKYYNYNFLKYFSFLSFILALIFYLIYILTKNSVLVITIPIVIFVFVRYIFLTTRTKKGEFPIDTVIYDWQLLLACLIYISVVVYTFL